MSASAFVPPVTVLLPFEGLRLRIQLDAELSSLVTEGEQLRTISRFQRYGESRANGEYIEGIAAVSSISGLIIGLHRRLYVHWITPTADPVLNFSRYYLSILGLPIGMTQTYISQRAILLLQTQVFARPDSLDL